MQAEIISIGDELLIGQTINTNASWLGNELSLIGIPVKRCVTISDDESSILEAIDSAFKRSDLIIVTGGLGPTKDDITKHTLCKFFDTTLEINETILERVKSFFTSRGLEMLEVNIQQAALPKNCEVLDNVQGTASGMWFDHNGSILISLPGVPYEMKGIMKKEVFPRLINRTHAETIFHKTILLQGIGESYLADRMKNWEKRIHEDGLGLAYLPSVGVLKLRITSPNGEKDSELIESYFSELQKELPKNVFGRNEDVLSEVVGKLLTSQNKTIGTVESCTGGGLARSLVSIPGSSSYFQGSLLTYSNKLKHKLVNVNEDDLLKFGAVSKEIILQMAKNGREILDVDICVSTSGIAGPDGGSVENPVGAVWIGVATKESVFAYKFQFGDHRERNNIMTILSALNLVRCSLLNIELKNK